MIHFKLPLFCVRLIVKLVVQLMKRVMQQCDQLFIHELSIRFHSKKGAVVPLCHRLFFYVKNLSVHEN